LEQAVAIHENALRLLSVERVQRFSLRMDLAVALIAEYTTRTAVEVEEPCA
jgi:hypothetical protein